ncbi:MAG: DUF6630 family protein [Oscillospiraceae bacterium]|jgi:hypothetical protein|uniref:DUF6630 family protein n=1 Tax=Porcipelethomonas sp. TaxID=2981675 RepID=UPI003077FD64
MGLFERLFKTDKNEKKDLSYIYKITELITNNNSGIINALKENIMKSDSDDDCWLGMVDLLDEEGYAFGIDYKCELEDFLWALKQLKTYSLIDINLSSLNLIENENVESWGEEINTALGGRAYICMIDIDSDSYELIIVNADVYEKISHIAESNGHTIDDL